MNHLSEIIENIHAGRRIERDDVRVLLAEADLLTLGMLANAIRFFHHPEPMVTYVVDRNINYTNPRQRDCYYNLL